MGRSPLTKVTNKYGKELSYEISSESWIYSPVALLYVTNEENTKLPAKKNLTTSGPFTFLTFRGSYDLLLIRKI